MAAAAVTPLERRMGELRLRFVERAGKDRGRIQAALNAGDLPQVHQLAHRLHGIAGTFGFTEVTAAAAELEDAIDQQRPDIADHAARLLDELAEIAPQVS